MVNKIDSSNKSGIYIIKNFINNKSYIGSAINLLSRFNKHNFGLLKKHHNPPLQNFVNKYGLNTLSFELLEVVLDKNKLLEREQFYIDSYKFSDLFNILKIAGSPLGTKRTEASKKMSGIMKGRITSEVTKKKMSKAAIGRKHTEETKKKIGKKSKGHKYNLGRKRSEKSKNKLRKMIFIYKEGILIDKVLGNRNLANIYDLDSSTISKVCNGKLKTTKGYTMVYA